MYRTDFWTLWEKARVGCFKRTASKHVCYLGWNRSPAQVGCMRQVLRPGALGRPRGIGWRGRCEGVSGWGTHVNPRLIHFNVWQNPLQYCKVISLQLIKKKKKKLMSIESMMPSNHLILCHPLLLLPSVFPNIKVFSNEFASGGHNIGISASALPMSIQCWFPVGLICLISMLSKGLSRIFSNSTIQKHRFFGTQPLLYGPTLTSVHDY